MTSLKKKAITGGSWLVILRILTRGIDLIRIGILARLLSTADFGIFALVTTTLNLFETLTETGFSYALIHMQRDVTRYTRTILFLNSVRGFLLMLLTGGLSVLIGRFFQSPDIIPLLLLASIIPFLKGLQNPMIVLFYKDLTLNKEFIFKAFPLVISLMTTIVLALYLHSVYAMILGLIIATCVETIFSYIVAPINFSSPFNRTHLRELFSYGKWITGGGVVGYLLTQIDNIVIGKIFGPSILGFYDLSFKLANMAFSEISDILAKITFPVFSKVQKNNSILKNYVRKSFLLVSPPAFLLSLIFYIFPEIVLSFFYGDKWIAAAPLLRSLALYGFLRSVTGPFGPFFLSIGQPDILTKASIVQFGIVVLSLFPFITTFGIVGVAYSLTIGYLFITPYFIFKMNKYFSK